MNNFVFSGIHNLQKTGSAMGTICSPTCINIFMRKFEKNICPYIHQFSNFYHRFFLDKVFLWKRTMKRLPEFIKELNNHRPTIKFDFNNSKTSTDYLDTTDYKTKGKNKL